MAMDNAAWNNSRSQRALTGGLARLPDRVGCVGRAGEAR